MMHLDRELQLKILTDLREEYPEFGELDKLFDANDKKIQVNLFYLAEHGLLEPSAIREALGVPRMMLLAKITAEGLDFLEADGGLNAILNVVTIKFDADSVRKLIEEKISLSTIAQEEKESLLSKVRGFSGDVLKSIVLKLVEKGIEKPDQITKLIEMLSRMT
jgi:hypothetical protein